MSTRTSPRTSNEVQWVHELFPEAEYADVYDRYGLLDERSVLAHGVHLTEEELELLAHRGTRIAHCPNSNLFLGSGLFKLHHTLDAGVAVGLGTRHRRRHDAIDVHGDGGRVQSAAGAGRVADARSISGTSHPSAARARCRSTRRSGSLEPGKSADFLLLDLKSTPLVALRSERASSVEDLLAGLIFTADDRVVRECWIARADGAPTARRSSLLAALLRRLKRRRSP